MTEPLQAKAQAIAESIENILRTPRGPERAKLVTIASEVLDEYGQQGRITSEEHALLRSMLNENNEAPMPLVQLSHTSLEPAKEKYECDCCGACCQGHLIVEVYDLDVMREPHLVTAAKPLRQDQTYDTLLKDFAKGKCLVIAAGSPCKFLTETFKCAVYPTRPNACVGMEAGDDQCQYARTAAGLPPLEPLR